MEWELGSRARISFAETCLVSIPLANYNYTDNSTLHFTTIVNCTLPEEPSNGTIVDYERSMNETGSEGTVLTYQCDNGLTLTGPNTITCTNAGVWNPEPEAIMCALMTEGVTTASEYLIRLSII